MNCLPRFKKKRKSTSINFQKRSGYTFLLVFEGKEFLSTYTIPNIFFMFLFYPAPGPFLDHKNFSHLGIPLILSFSTQNFLPFLYICVLAFSNSKCIRLQYLSEGPFFLHDIYFLMHTFSKARPHEYVNVKRKWFGISENTIYCFNLCHSWTLEYMYHSN